MDIFWKRKYKINKENEIMVKCEIGNLIFKLGIWYNSWKCFIYNSWKRDCDEKWGYILLFMILDLVIRIIVIRLWFLVL